MQQKKTTSTRTAASAAATKAVADKKALKYNYEEPTGPVAATYLIRSGGGIAYMLAQTDLTVYDKEKDEVRAIRYCPNEQSIYVDEQSQYAKRGPIVFYEGRLFVPSDKPNLKKFLDAHPYNIANGGNLFSREDVRKQTEEKLDNEFLVIDAVNLVKNKTIDELLPVAMFFHVNTDRSASDIKFDLLRIAKSKPNDFIESFDNPTVQTRALLTKAQEYNIIKMTDSGCFWFDSNSMIVSVPVGQSPLDVLTRFCLTDKGASVLEDIEKQLS